MLLSTQIERKYICICYLILCKLSELDGNQIVHQDWILQDSSIIVFFLPHVYKFKILKNKLLTESLENLHEYGFLSCLCYGDLVLSQLWEHQSWPLFLCLVVSLKSPVLSVLPLGYSNPCHKKIFQCRAMIFVLNKDKSLLSLAVSIVLSQVAWFGSTSRVSVYPDHPSYVTKNGIK